MLLQESRGGKKVNITKIKKFSIQYFIPILFFAISLIGFFISGLSVKIVLNDLIERIGRNLFLVLALLIPVLAGMGINFALVVGAMVGQIALIIVIAFHIGGIGGIFLSIFLSIPLSVICGTAVGILLNKAKGKEMVTSLVIGYFVTGIYQLICLSMPVNNQLIAVEEGIGIKSTIDLKSVQYALDYFPVQLRVLGIKIPILPILFCVIFGFLLVYFKHTKLGYHMKVVGLDQKTAQAIGMPIDKIRLIAIIASTVFASWGQIISLQNIGTLSTYGSHEQVSIYSAAALLVGGATIKKATVKNAVLGTILFYCLFIVAPKAGANLFSDPQIGEFFRVFIAYGVIAFALVFYQKKEENNAEG